MTDYLAQIDPLQVILIILCISSLIIGVSNVIESGESIHKRFTKGERKLTKRVETLEVNMEKVNLRISQLEEQVEKRVDGERILLSSVKTLLNKELGLIGNDELVDAVSQIDMFLIERRD